MPVWKDDDAESVPNIGEQLNQQQMMEMMQLLEESANVLRDDGGKTNLIEHDLFSGSTGPI